MNVKFQLRDAGANKGLGLFALQDFKENELIFEEYPIFAAQFVWNSTYGYSACSHCLRPMETTEENIKRLTNNKITSLPFPEYCPTSKDFHRYCDNCGVGFCSEMCKQGAILQYHSAVCGGLFPGLNKLFEEWKTMHYPPETTSITLLVKLIGYIEQSNDREKAISSLLQFAHNFTNENEDMLLKFLGPGHMEKLRRIHTIIHEVLPTPFVKSFITEDGLKTLFALIGRNGQGIGTSVFSEWVKVVERLNLSSNDKVDLDKFIDNTYEAIDEHVGSFINCEGSGLYEVQRYFNHSCIPNASVTFPFSSYRLNVICTRDIKEGEEICISYLDECMLKRSRHSRNKELRDYYLFNCQCEKCLEQTDDPDVTSDEETGSEDEMDDSEAMAL